MMSGVEVKNTGQDHTVPPAEPPPYTGPPPSVGPTVVQPGAGMHIHLGTTRVIHSVGVTPTQIVVSPQMTPNPNNFVCPSCNQQIVTRVEYKASTKTHLFALLICVVGGCFCVCLPYCMNSCKNANHYCPNCNAYLGVYKN